MNRMSFAFLAGSLRSVARRSPVSLLSIFITTLVAVPALAPHDVSHSNAVSLVNNNHTARVPAASIVRTAPSGRIGQGSRLHSSRAVSKHTAAVTSAAGLTTDDLSNGTLTAADLAQTLVGPGVSISNAQFTGAPVAGGTFSSSDNSILGLGYGVVLSTGRVSSVVGPNQLDATSTDNGQPGDPILSSLAGQPTYDAAILEFDFVPVSSTISFNYVFGSEEYNEYVNTQYNDVFAFFINGTNCATVPGTTTPVSVDTINGGNPFGSNNASNPTLYRNNELRDSSGNFIGGPINTELDGLTTVLTCAASVNPGVVNHARLAIADATDALYDSDVFIQAGSFSVRVPSWVAPTPSDRTVFDVREGSSQSFTMKAAAASQSNISITSSQLPAGVTCTDTVDPGNPAQVDCTIAPTMSGFSTVVFNAQYADGTSAGTRTYTVGADRYVALGDSFSSGEGTFAYDSGTDIKTDKCHRSTPDAYPGLLSNLSEVPGAFTFVACSGAVVNNVTTTGQYSEPAQITAISKGKGNDVTLATISIGGNDAGFAPVLKQCVQSHVCRGQDAKVSAAIEKLAGPLQSLYTQIKQLAPKARLLVVGYPHLFPSPGATSCTFFGGLDGLSLSVDDQNWLNEKVAQIDAVIQTSALASGVEYVDVYSAFEGHEVCSDPNSYVNAIVLNLPSTDPQSESFHPNTKGQQALEAIVDNQIVQGPPGQHNTIYPNQTIASTTMVSSGQAQATFATTWPGSDVVMSLVSPSGRIIDRNIQSSDVAHQLGPTYEVYTVANPESGMWSVNLYGSDVAQDGEQVILNVTQAPHVNQPPIGSFTASSTTGDAPLQVTFDASGSSDPDGSITQYSWDFGDGTSGSGIMPTHTYTQTGVYTPLLTITDDGGAIGYAGTMSITVTASTSSPSATPTNVPPPTTPPTTTPVPPAPPTTAPAPTIAPAPPVAPTTAPVPPATTPPHSAPSVTPPQPTATPLAPSAPCAAPSLNLRLPQHSVYGGGLLPFDLRTAPGARGSVTLQVTATKLVWSGTGKHRKRVRQSVVLYKVTRQGTADRHGRFKSNVYVGYQPSGAVRAGLTVTAQAACGRAGPRLRTQVMIQPLLTLLLSHHSVTSGGTLPFSLRTAPRAHVSATLRVLSTRVTYKGTGKHRKKIVRTRVLYSVTRSGVASAKGQFAGTLRVTYKSARAVAATLSVSVRAAGGAETLPVGVTILPPRHQRR